MLRLLRFSARKPPLSSPFRRKPIARRVWSPMPGGSTLMTSAPMSPSSMQQKGPAITWLTSRTLRWDRGRVMEGLSGSAIQVGDQRGDAERPGLGLVGVCDAVDQRAEARRVDGDDVADNMGEALSG